MNSKDPLRYFRIEAREIAEQLSRGALAIEAAATPDAVAGMLRLAHTLKGAASVVKQRDIAGHSHALEDALAPLRDRLGPVTAREAEGILVEVDAIAALVAALAAPQPAGKPEMTVAGPAGDSVIEETGNLLRADGEEMDLLLDGIAELGREMRGMRRTIGLTEQARQVSGLLAARAAIGGDKAVELAGELHRLIRTLEQRLRDALEGSERQATQVHAAAERLRLLPAATVLSALERAARDVAQSVGKRATLRISGGEVRLDSQVLALVQRALVQLLRNAVAHGIESPAARVAAGKPEAGRITIEIARRGERVGFACRDDGAGIDFVAVRRAAEARGAEPGASDAAVLDLLLAGGLSTSADVTEVSGRGVGLDVVREIARRLGGELSASSTPGEGTRIELIVPVSLTALEVLLVETGGATAAIPLAAVRRVMPLDPAAISRLETGRAILHDGELVRLAPLGALLRAAHDAAPAKIAVVIASGTTLAALEIDRLLGASNIVVRRVPPLALADPVVAGVHLDGEGAPRPVLDPDALVAAVLSLPGEWLPAPPMPRRPILVIDDSLTTRVLEQSILEAAGYEVDLAVSAEQGLEMARRRHYGLFLVDVEMPGMDGFTFVETVVADPELKETPAILVTSRDAPEDRRRGLEAGARAYIVKGKFDQGEALEIIRALVG